MSSDINNQQPFSGLISPLNDDDLAFNTDMNLDTARNTHMNLDTATHVDDSARNTDMNLDTNTHGDDLAGETEATSDVVHDSALPFECGQRFLSFSKLEEAISSYEKKHFAVLVKARSEKWPEGHKNRETLVYKTLVYTCKKGKIRHKSEAKGDRPNVSSGKLGCQFKLKLSTNGNALVIKEATLTHTGHELTEERYLHLPEQLRLTPAETKDAELVLKTSGNKKKLQAHLIAQRGGKPVTLRTLHNMAAKIRGHQIKEEASDLEKMVEAMKTIPEASMKLAYEEETNELIGVYFQDKRMKYVFEKYPELIIFDATYKLNNYKLPLFVLLSVDGNGESEIVALFLIRAESKACVGTMLEFFKSDNQAWEMVEVIVGDKDFADRNVFKDIFPSAQIHVCLFHALRTFKREIASRVPDVGPSLKDEVLQIFTDLVYADSEEAYEIGYSKLISLNIESLTAYYNSNWHPIKDEWVLYAQNLSFIFKNRTSNRLESLNEKIKQVITRYSSLSNFFTDLMISVSSMSVERDHRALKLSERVPVWNGNLDDIQIKIRETLTKFAADHVLKEYVAMKKIAFTNVMVDSATLDTKNSVIMTTHNSCTCGFLSSMGLPCRHVMAFRSLKELPPFEMELCRQRWTRSYFITSHPVHLNNRSRVSSQRGQINVVTKPRTECEKYSEANRITSEINSVLSTMSNDKFVYYLEKLKEFRALLHEEKLLSIQEVSGETFQHHMPSAQDLSNTPSTSAVSSQIRDLPSSEVVQGLSDTPSTSAVSSQIRDLPSSEVVQDSSDTPSTSAVPSHIELTAIKLPKPMKKNGNSKGFGQTVIGLDRGKKRKRPATVRSDIFQNKSPREKLKFVLQIFVDPEVAERALSGILIAEDEVSVIPEIVTMQRLKDERISIQSIQQYFEPDAYLIVQQLKTAISDMGWYCCDCLEELEANSVQCDLCLSWFNWTCQGITVNPPSKYWFCTPCRSQRS